MSDLAFLLIVAAVFSVVVALVLMGFVLAPWLVLLTLVLLLVALFRVPLASKAIEAATEEPSSQNHSVHPTTNGSGANPSNTLKQQPSIQRRPAPTPSDSQPPSLNTQLALTYRGALYKRSKTAAPTHLDIEHANIVGTYRGCPCRIDSPQSHSDLQNNSQDDVQT